MTTPGAGGANLGTAYGKVRVDYESSGVARATKDVEAFQTSLVKTGKQLDSTTKGALTAAASINKFGAQTAVMKNPAAGMAKSVEKELQQVEQAIANIRKTIKKQLESTEFSTAFYIKPIPKIDNSNFDKAISEWKKTATKEISLDDVKITLDPAVTIDLGKVAEAGKAAKNAFCKQVSEVEDCAVNAGNLFNTQLQTSVQGGSKKAGGQAAAALGGAFGGGILKLGAKAGVIGAALGGVGYTLTKGFSRLQGLDQAAVKLKALGLQVNQIKGVSEAALHSVEGTAFGLDEAFSTAANAINSGIKPGKQLTKYLEATANTAALAGVGMEDLGQSFGQAAVQGKLTGDILQLLYSRNVPVLKLLAEEYGVTQEKARDMVSNGEVDFERFINAMSRTGGAAKLMGNTISGSFSNLKAAISRLGAAILAPLFGEATGEASTFAKAIQWVTGVVDEFGKFLKAHKKGMIDFWGGIASAAVEMGRVIGYVISFISDAIIKVTEMVGDLAGWAAQAGAVISKAFGKDGAAKDLEDFARSAHDLGTGMRKNRDAGMGKMFDAFTKARHGVRDWVNESKNAGETTGDLGDEADDAAKKTTNLKDALEKLGVKGDSTAKSLKGTNAEFREFIKNLKDKKASQELIDTLQNIRDQYQNGGRQIEAYANSIDKLGDSTASASDKADSLISSLQGLGLLPGGDALESYNKEFEKMTSYQSTIIDLADTTGNALANLDGTINLNSKNGQNLYDQIKQIRREAVALMTSGEASPDEAYARTVQGLQQLLQQQAGLTPDVAQKVIDKYFPKDAIINSVKASGDPKKAIQDLFKGDPARLNSELNLLTTTQDILDKVVGPDGQLHVPTVLDVSKPDDTGGTKPVAPQPDLPPIPDDKEIKPGSNPQYGPFIPDTPGLFVGPDGKVYRESDLKKKGSATPEQSVFPPSVQMPSGTLNPTGLPGLLGSDQLGANLGQIANNKEALDKAFAENPDIAKTLEGLVTQAQAQGQNMGLAFADGILMGSDEVRKALLQLAQLAPDILGNSPAKYGPLSGKGWTFFRGQKFTSAFAEGVASETATLQNSVLSTANSAATGLVEPFDDRLTRLIGDMQQFSDFGKHLLNLGDKIGNIIFSTLGFADKLSGGALFPKSYVKDPNADTRRGSSLGPWNPKGGSVWKTNGAVGKPSAPRGLADGSQQGVADYIIQKALSAGYSVDEANAFVVQAFGESGLRANAFGATTGDKSGGASGIFQFTPDTWKDFGQGKDVLDAQANIDAYFRLAQARDPGTGDIKSRLAKVSGGGPAHSSNVGHWEKALAGAAPFISGAQRSTAQGNVPQGNWGLSGTTYGLDPSKDIRQGQAGFPDWVYQIADQFGLQASTYAGHQTSHNIDDGSGLPNPKGLNRGIDWWPKGNAQMYPGKTGYSAEEASRLQAFADYLAKSGLAEQVIFQNPRTGQQTGFPFNTDYSGDYGGHTGHVHTRHGRNLELGGSLPGTMPNVPVPVSLSQDDSSSLTDIAKNTQMSAGYSMPGKLQELVNGNPLLQQAVLAQGAGSGMTSDEVVPLLQGIDKEIAKQNALGTPESKSLSDALGTMKSNLQGQYGLQEGPSGLSMAQDISGGISSIAKDIFGVIDQSLKSVSATKEIGDTLIRGVANTDDVMKLIDNFQEYITLVQNVAQTVSDVSDLAGKFASMANVGGAPGTGGPQAVTSAISGISSIIAQVAGAVNTAIDLGQEAYAIITKYYGRWLTSFLGMPGAKDMNFLLDTVTGQLKAYTSENPSNKTTLNTWAKMMGSSQFQERPSPTNILTIYQGPGQDPRDTMNDAMFAVRASGVGVFGYEP